MTKSVNGQTVLALSRVTAEQVAFHESIVMAIWYACGMETLEQPREAQETLYDACVKTVADSNPEREVSLGAMPFSVGFALKCAFFQMSRGEGFMHGLGVP